MINFNKNYQIHWSIDINREPGKAVRMMVFCEDQIVVFRFWSKFLTLTIVFLDLYKEVYGESIPFCCSTAGSHI